MKKQVIKKAFIKSLPVMAGYIVLGMGFGILLKVNGYGLFWAFLMSTFVYAGSMQYVMVDLIASGASLLSVGLTALMVNARHLFYGISMINKYKGKGLKKLYLIFSLTDETYSLVVNEIESEDYYFYVSLLNQLYWIIGSLLGSLIATLISFNTRGIEFSMTALFVSVAVEQWINNKEHLPAYIGFLATLICLLIFGADNFLIPSMIVIVLLLSLSKKVLIKNERS